MRVFMLRCLISQGSSHPAGIWRRHSVDIMERLKSAATLAGVAFALPLILLSVAYVVFGLFAPFLLDVAYEAVDLRVRVDRMALLGLGLGAILSIPAAILGFILGIEKGILFAVGFAMGGAAGVGPAAFLGWIIGLIVFAIQGPSGEVYPILLLGLFAGIGVIVGGLIGDCYMVRGA